METQEIRNSYFIYRDRATHPVKELEKGKYSHSNVICEGYIDQLTQEEAKALRKDKYEVTLESEKEGEQCQNYQK